MLLWLEILYLFEEGSIVRFLLLSSIDLKSAASESTDAAAAAAAAVVVVVVAAHTAGAANHLGKGHGRMLVRAQSTSSCLSPLTQNLIEP